MLTFCSHLFNISHKTPPFKPINVVLGDDWRKDKNSLWWDIFGKLQLILRGAASAVLSPDEAHEFYRSITEEEFTRGVMHDQQSSQRCFWLHRTLRELEDHAADKGAANYIDIDWQTKSLDQDALRLRRKLVDETMPSALPAACTMEYQLEWTEDGVQPAVHAEHAKVRGGFGDDIIWCVREGVCVCVCVCVCA